jgi:phosphocarrier protein HPr
MVELEMKVIDEVGLHARPATLFVKKASEFQAAVRIRNKTSGSEWANAKSILEVLALGVEKDHLIELSIEGPDEDQAGQALASLIDGDFVAES